jgi:hypothetical protein
MLCLKRDLWKGGKNMSIMLVALIGGLLGLMGLIALIVGLVKVSRSKYDK